MIQIFIKISRVYYMNNIIYIITIIIILICIFVKIYYDIYVVSLQKTFKKSDVYDFIINNTNNKKYKNFTIIDYLKLISSTYPEHTALKIKNGNKWKKVNYLEYYNNICNFANSINKSFGENVNIGICGYNSPGLYYAYLGCMLNGGKAIIMQTMKSSQKIINKMDINILIIDNDKQLEKILKLNLEKIKLIIYYSPITTDILNKFTIPVVSMGSFVESHSTEEMNINYPKINDVATIIYKTNKSNGIVITHKNIVASLKNMINLVQKTNSINIGKDQCISYLPMNTMMNQIMNIFLPIYLVGTVWFSKKDVYDETLIKTLIEIKPTIFVGTKNIWENIMDNIKNCIQTNGIKGNLTKSFAPNKIMENIGLDKCNYFFVYNAFKNSQYISDYFKSLGITLNNIFEMDESCGTIAMSLSNLTKNEINICYPIVDIKITKNDEIIIKGKNVFETFVEPNNNSF